MSDLVQRLRDKAAIHDGWAGELGATATADLLREAADELDRRQFRLRDLMDAREKGIAEIERLTIANESLERDRFWWLSDAGRGEREKELQEQIERLTAERDAPIVLVVPEWLRLKCLTDIAIRGYVNELTDEEDRRLVEDMLTQFHKAIAG